MHFTKIIFVFIYLFNSVFGLQESPAKDLFIKIILETCNGKASALLSKIDLNSINNNLPKCEEEEEENSKSDCKDSYIQLRFLPILKSNEMRKNYSPPKSQDIQIKYEFADQSKLFSNSRSDDSYDISENEKENAVTTESTEFIASTAAPIKKEILCPFKKGDNEDTEVRQKSFTTVNIPEDFQQNADETESMDKMQQTLTEIYHIHKDVIPTLLRFILSLKKLQKELHASNEKNYYNPIKDKYPLKRNDKTTKEMTIDKLKSMNVTKEVGLNRLLTEIENGTANYLLGAKEGTHPYQYIAKIQKKLDEYRQEFIKHLSNVRT